MSVYDSNPIRIKILSEPSAPAGYHWIVFCDARGYINHRLDGPAVEWDDGYYSWWVDGYNHRLDGPAIIDPRGFIFWYIKGDRYTNFKDFQEAGKLTEDQMTILKLKYGEIK